jgi:GH24 family phage-related lysozyme (muramidase)
MARLISSEGLALIKHFEGLSLVSYPDPGNPSTGEPWTIGFGHTRDVRPGMTISENEAEMYLQEDLAHFEEGVERLISGLGLQEFSACVSWAFNVGLGAAEDSTLRRRILSGESPQIVLPEELPRWDKGAEGPMAGLTRRRAAEVELALKDAVSPEKAPQGLPLNPDTPHPQDTLCKAAEVSLIDFFTYFDGSYHQKQAVRVLQDALHGHDVLSPGHEWVATFRNHDLVDDSIEEVNQPASPIQGDLVQLNVPYMYQLDSEVAGQGGRMCFSSTNSMLVEYLKPGTLKGASQADDAYLLQVLEYGDTTSAEAQVAALGYYGITARFRMDGTTEAAKNLLRKSIPVPIGVLHKGPASSPTGTGHWLLLVGFDNASGEWICHDPNGEMDCARGGYVSNSPTAGRYVRYSFKNLDQRWIVAGEGDGWYVETLSWT